MAGIHGETCTCSECNPSFSIQLQELIGPRKPCPFCGSNDLELNCWEEYVVCKGCDASAPAMRWQFRAAQP